MAGGAPAAERQLREGFAWQCRLVRALQEYADKAAGAFDALVLVHEVLDEGGIGKVLDAAPLAQDLLLGFREAAAAARGAAAASRELLGSHRASLDACAGLLREADAAEAGRRHYRGKVEALEAARKPAARGAAKLTRSCRSEADKGSSAKLTRNREKLQRATARAALAQDSAGGALQACAGRRANLCQLAVGSVAAVAKAVRCAAAAVGAESSPYELCSRRSLSQISRHHAGDPRRLSDASTAAGEDPGRLSRRHSSLAAPSTLDEEHTGESPRAPNPFELDLERGSEEEGPPQCEAAKADSDTSSTGEPADSKQRPRGFSAFSSSADSWTSGCWGRGDGPAPPAPSSKGRTFRSRPSFPLAWCHAG